MMTILASYAQEESLSASENQKWRVRKAFENGELINLRFLFGYSITADGVQINEKEAVIVREIFSRFNGGESMSSISRDLNAKGYRGALGGKWCAKRMRNTLSNEKYLGNALLQKRYRNNHIEKKLVANKGELPMYYAEGTHEPIIDSATFEQAQERLRKIAQQTANRKKPSRLAFSGLIRCGICGNTYKRVTYRGRLFWNCTTFQTKGKSECTAKKIPEDTLMALTLEVLGIDRLSTKVVKSKITEIRAEEGNMVIFCMDDGSEIVKRWKNRSRAESWTPEMKEQARQRALQARRKKGMSRTAARSVTVIPPTINPLTHLSKVTMQKRRVAGYARVSTDSDEQFTSYEAQVDCYTQYIKRNPEWKFVKVYTDEGISGTNTKHRIGFNEMIADAMSGKIDLIVTKSISRFARNTVDSLVTIQKLKEKGVEVFFEKENIYTFDGKGELLLTIMSSLAQEESHSISENVTWGQRKRFADRKVTLPYKQFLGYRKGADGFPEVVPEEAVIVRRIYTRFMEGLTPVAIAKELTADGIPTPAGKQRWQTSTVESILKNEKYKGAALLQKCFTVDFLTKKKKVNEGEVPQYYVEHSHEPIITPEEFDKVQTKFERRKRISRQYSGKSLFSSRIICGDCGAFFGSKVWNSTSKYRRVIWQCNNKFKGEHKCETPHLDEEAIKTRFVGAFNAILADKDSALENCRLIQSTLTDCTGIDKEIQTLLEEIEVVTELTKRCIAENSQTAQNQEEYTARYNGFVERYEKAKTRVEELRSIKTERQAQADAIGAFMFEVQELDAFFEFDEKLWLTVIDTVTVHADGRMTFKFQGGTEIEG